MKLNDYKNMKHAGGRCPSCRSESVVYDEFHGETFCLDCGLVLGNATRKSIVELIEEARFELYVLSIIIIQN